MLAITCDGSAEQTLPIVMPHSVREQRSTYGQFTAQRRRHAATSRSRTAST